MGTAKLIQSDAQYSVDKYSGVQLVCKYLKAYDTGGKKGINRLYKEGIILSVITLSYRHGGISNRWTGIWNGMMKWKMDLSSECTQLL